MDNIDRNIHYISKMPTPHKQVTVDGLVSIALIANIPAEELMNKVNLVDNLTEKVDLCIEIIATISDNHCLNNWIGDQWTRIPLSCERYTSDAIIEGWIREFKNKKPKKNRAKRTIDRHLKKGLKVGSLKDNNYYDNVRYSFPNASDEQLYSFAVAMRDANIAAWIDHETEAAINDFFYLLKKEEEKTFNKLLEVLQDTGALYAHGTQDFQGNQGCLSVLILVIVSSSVFSICF